MIAWIAALAWGLLMAGGDGESPKPVQHARAYVAEEAPFLDPAAGETLRFLGRYQGRLGDRFTVGTNELPIAFEAEQTEALFRRGDLRQAWLELHVKAERAETGAIRYTLISVSDGPSPEKYFREVTTGALDQLATDHRQQLALWAVREGDRAGTEYLSSSGRELLIRVLDEQAHRPPHDDPETCEWFASGARVFGEDPRWQRVVLSFANRHALPTAWPAHLEQNGFVLDHDGWRLRARVLADAGLVDVDGSAVTRERARLLTALKEWKGIDRSSRLLRGFTAEHYANATRQGNVRTGMDRREVVLAWGYPENVTWINRNRGFYEAWFFANGRSAFFADGLLFRADTD